jgi:hypothetical protein
VVTVQYLGMRSLFMRSVSRPHRIRQQFAGLVADFNELLESDIVGGLPAQAQTLLRPRSAVGDGGSARRHSRSRSRS